MKEKAQNQHNPYLVVLKTFFSDVVNYNISHELKDLHLPF